MQIECLMKVPIPEPKQCLRNEKVKSRMKLPKLEMKKFSGDPKEYRTFRDAFEVSINNDRGLSGVEKFTYPQTCLTGEASRSIKGLALSNENYEQALEVLDQRYGNKQIIINSHMEAHIKTAPVTNAT